MRVWAFPACRTLVKNYIIILIKSLILLKKKKKNQLWSASHSGIYWDMICAKMPCEMLALS